MMSVEEARALAMAYELHRLLGELFDRAEQQARAIGTVVATKVVLRILHLPAWSPVISAALTGRDSFQSDAS